MQELFFQNIEEYKKQMALGNIQNAYKGVIKYMMGLRTHFLNEHSDHFVTGSFYQGYMGITYFPVTPLSLKNQKLKIGLIFNHRKVWFEIWLVGQNKKVQKSYWNQFKDNDWKKYPLSKAGKDSIIKHVLIEKPNFKHLDVLTETIEKDTLKFIEEVSKVILQLSEHSNDE
ncbi:DUF7000 family protein [Allomuricauda sp. R78024]|uniref:DUF7000 family protein n=1 Tax=Allomuricauda sp. R78024 TaxID=3093867 RepID=UPI0037CA9989